MAKQTISIGKKIHVIIMTLFSVLFILTSFTDILEHNPIIDAEFLNLEMEAIKRNKNKK